MSRPGAIRGGEFGGGGGYVLHFDRGDGASFRKSADDTVEAFLFEGFLFEGFLFEGRGGVSYLYIFVS